MADVPHPTYNGRSVENSPEEERAATDTLGSDTFNKPDPGRSIWPNLSEGQAAVERFRRGATPSDVVGEFQGRRTHDIELPKGKK